MYFSKKNISISLSSTGASTHYVPNMNGEVRTVMYDSTVGSSALDITITTEESSQSVLAVVNIGSTTAAAVQYAPLQTAHTTTGGSTTPSIPIGVANERLKCVFGGGAASGTGTLTVIASGNFGDS